MRCSHFGVPPWGTESCHKTPLPGGVNGVLGEHDRKARARAATTPAGENHPCGRETPPTQVKPGGSSARTLAVAWSLVWGGRFHRPRVTSPPTVGCPDHRQGRACRPSPRASSPRLVANQAPRAAGPAHYPPRVPGRWLFRGLAGRVGRGGSGGSRARARRRGPMRRPEAPQDHDGHPPVEPVRTAPTTSTIPARPGCPSRSG